MSKPLPVESVIDTADYEKVNEALAGGYLLLSVGTDSHGVHHYCLGVPIASAESSALSNEELALDLLLVSRDLRERRRFDSAIICETAASRLRARAEVSTHANP
jgi:hypothetical protein